MKLNKEIKELQNLKGRLFFESDERGGLVKDSVSLKGLTFTLEIHKSKVLVELKDYFIEDLLPGGRLMEREVEMSPELEELVTNGYYHIHPMKPEYYLQPNKCLSNYCYLMDTEEGMRVFHLEPEPEPSGEDDDVSRSKNTLTRKDYPIPENS